GERAAELYRRLDVVFAAGDLERIACNVVDHGPGIALGPAHRTGRAGRHHRVVHLPVLVAHRRGLRPAVVEEDLARRLLARAFQVGALIDAIERRLDDARILAGLDLLLQPIALGAARDV